MAIFEFPRSPLDHGGRRKACARPGRTPGWEVGLARRWEGEEPDRLPFQEGPFYRTAIELSTHILFCAGYADDVLPPLADALGEAGFRVARVAGEGVPSAPPADLLRAEATIRSAVGVLDLGREMEAVPQGLDRTARRLAGRCLDILARMKARSRRRLKKALGRPADGRVVGEE